MEVNDSPTAAPVENEFLLLVAGCQRDDRVAQRQLYEVCRERVFRTALRIVGPNDADDVSQQVFLKTFQTIRQFHGESRFETWLYRLVVNECLQHLRTRRRRPAQPIETDLTDRARSGLDGVEERELIKMALERLEPDLRIVFVLREIEQLSYEEIALATGISDGTVASRLNRARRQLKEILLQLGWEP